MTNKLTQLIRTLLLGVAQVMLQPSVFVGAIFFLGLLINSIPIALCALLGCFSGTMAGFFPGMKEEERTQGLYGFNGLLVGAALSYFFQVDAVIITAIILGGVCSTLVIRAILHFNLKPLTFPFILVTWIATWILGLIGVEAIASPLVPSNTISLLNGLTFGFAQVMFQENIITGILFLFAITWRDRWEGTHALLGVFMGVVFGWIFGFPSSLINLGLYGYNGVLCGIVFAGNNKSNWLWSFLAILLSILIARGMQIMDLYTLTFPFVLSSWVFLFLRKKVSIK